MQSLRPDAKSAGIYGSQGKDDYEDVDVEYYFNYMGLLAVEGTYDRMNALMETGIPSGCYFALGAEGYAKVRGIDGSRCEPQR